VSAAAARAAQVLTHLSHPDRLAVLASLSRRGPDGATITAMASELDMPVTRVGDAVSRLRGIGLATGTGNGVYRVRLDGLREAAYDIEKEQPISRLLVAYPELKPNFVHGRVKELPPTMSDRSELMGELLARFLDLDGLYEEAEINRRLSAVTDDVAGARRMLVETGWLERDRAGTTYGLGRQLPADDELPTDQPFTDKK
jgi:hypothetical protein